MLDTSPKAFWEELEASRRQTEKRSQARKDMIHRYTGPFYDQEEKPASSEPENPAFEWLSTMASQIVAGEPACSIKTQRADRPMSAAKARALQHATNRSAREQKMRTKAMKFFVDGCFGAGIAHITRKPVPWLDRGPLDGPIHRPAVGRVRYELWRCDSRATDWEDTRWRGHGAITSKKALLARAKIEDGWRVKEINALKEETGLTGFMPKEGEGLNSRDDVKVWCVWIPEEQLDPDFSYEAGFWGTVHYYAESGNGGESSPLVEIRDPQPYYGCREGPYHMYGQMYVPDRLHPLAIMVAIEQTAKTMGLVSRVIESAMKTYKRFVMEGSGQKNLGMLLKNVQHGGVLKVKGFQKGMAEEYTTGGIDNNMVAMYQFLTEQMDKRSGLTQTAKGNTRSGTTATAETYAAMGGNARVALTRDGFYAFMGDVFAAQAAMIDQDDEFWMPPPPGMENEAPEGIFGGREPGETFEDYELSIQPLSMRYRSEEERAAAADYEIQLFERIAPLAVSAPYVDIPGILLDVADARGESQLPSRFDKQLAGMIAAMMLQNEMVAQAAYQPGQVSDGPAMAGDSAGGRAMLQPPVPMAQVASAASRGKPAGGGSRAPTGKPAGGGMAPGPASPRSRGASKGNQARKATFGAQGGRPRGT